MKFGKQLATAGLAALVAGSALVALPAQTSAQADQYERSLAGVRLNSKASVVLKYFGNPNDVVIGDVGVREAPNTGGTTGGAASGADPRSGGAPMGGRGAMAPGATSGRGGSLGPSAPMGSSGGGFGGSFGGAEDPEKSGGFGGSDPRSGGGFGAPSGGFGAPSGTFGAPGGGFGAQGGGGGQFGSTLSNLTPQQETTWIYNRRAGKDVVSYEFLIGNGGVVTQIRVIGYAGGSSKTRKGVALGSTYRTVVERYGVPEQQMRVGRSLIASYKNRHHVLFQFLNQRSQTEDPFSAGNKVIAITIASVE